MVTTPIGNSGSVVPGTTLHAARYCDAGGAGPRREVRRLSWAAAAAGELHGTEYLRSRQAPSSCRHSPCCRARCPCRRQHYSRPLWQGGGVGGQRKGTSAIENKEAAKLAVIEKPLNRRVQERLLHSIPEPALAANSSTASSLLRSAIRVGRATGQKYFLIWVALVVEEPGAQGRLVRAHASLCLNAHPGLDHCAANGIDPVLAG